MTDQELQKIADEASLEITDQLFPSIGIDEAEKSDDQISKLLIPYLAQVRDAQEEKLKYIKKELEIALGKCHGSLSYPVGTILKQLILEIGDTQ